MTWTTPKVVEISVGMEINSYACAELWSANPFAADGRGEGAGTFTDGESISRSVLRVRVLGAAVGGRFPQCHTDNEVSQCARRGDSLALAC
jgi:coenzyme PQQ precursor peptide PqqA